MVMMGITVWLRWLRPHAERCNCPGGAVMAAAEASALAALQQVRACKRSRGVGCRSAGIAARGGDALSFAICLAGGASFARAGWNVAIRPYIGQRVGGREAHHEG